MPSFIFTITASNAKTSKGTVIGQQHSPSTGLHARVFPSSHSQAQETRDGVSSVSAKDPYFCGSGLELPTGLNGSAMLAGPKKEGKEGIKKEKEGERKKKCGRKGEDCLLSLLL